MNQESKLKIFFFALIFITIILVIFSIIEFKKPILTGKYIYTSPSGEQFEFNKRSLENITTHVLTIYTYDKQGKHQYDIPFLNQPYDLEDIQIEKNLKDKLLTKQGIFLTLNPNSNSKSVLAAVEIARVLGTNSYGVFKIPTQSATTIPTNTSFPYITCANATKQIGVIQFFVGNKTRVGSIGECVYVEGKDYDELIKASDKLTLNLLGVM